MDFNADTPATHTRSLHLSQREEAWITPLNLVQYFEHFRSFDRVESLTLSYFACRVFSRTTLQLFFRNLIPTVRKLRLRHPIGCPTSILQLISIFTSLRHTTIHAPHWEPTTNTVNHVAAPHILRGELHLSDLEDDCGPFLSLLSQRMQYERITLERCGLRDLHPLQRFISSAGTSLRKLYFVEGNGKLVQMTSISKFLQALISPLDRREVPNISLSECTVLEFLFISVVGPETSFNRIASILYSVVSPRFRKVVLEAALREFPDIYCSVVRSFLVDGVSQLDQPLCALAKRIVREDREKFLFILLTHNALELAQQLTEFNREGDILTGEKVIGGGHSCVYIPATTCLRETLDGKAGLICDICGFL